MESKTSRKELTTLKPISVRLSPQQQVKLAEICKSANLKNSSDALRFLIDRHNHPVPASGHEDMELRNLVFNLVVDLETFFDEPAGLSKEVEKLRKLVEMRLSV